MISHIKDVAREAQKGGYALSSFNIHNIESILGVVQAAEKAKLPALIQVSESTIKYIGLKSIVSLVTTAANTLAPSVKIALHLDHGRSYKSAVDCIKAGFTSVHIDGSDLSLEDNIKVTKQVIAFARPKGVWVQGEVGAMVGGHGSVGGTIEIPKAALTDVLKFAKETKVDTIAAAIGTAHGDYDNEDVDVALLKAIKEKVKQPFVLHGGSGVDDKIVLKGIRNGINIVNIGTDVKVAFCKTVIENAKKNPNETDPRVLLAPAIAAVEKVAYDKLKLFSSMSPNCVWPRIKA